MAYLWYYISLCLQTLRKNMKNCNSRICVSGPTFEPGTSLKWSRRANPSIATFCQERQRNMVEGAEDNRRIRWKLKWMMDHRQFTGDRSTATIRYSIECYEKAVAPGLLR
jgi:hypothetical protein